MILVQNHRQPSNGSKLLLLLFLFMTSFSSCELFKKIQDDSTDEVTNVKDDELKPIPGRRVLDPETGEYIVIEDFPVEKMDTIMWREVSTTSSPPIASSSDISIDVNPVDVLNVDDIGSEILSSYNVVLALPFLGHKFDETASELYENSLWAVNFYAGAKMALEVLDNEGVSLNVSVLDTRASSSYVGALLQTKNDIRNANLIIGPYRKDNIVQMAQYAMDRDITLVSPQGASSKITAKNPNYVQVNPTLKTHCEAIMEDVLKHYDPKNIVLVTKSKPNEKARLKYFYDAYLNSVGKEDTVMLHELIIADSESAELKDMDLMPFIELSDTTVFIVPSWSESFVYSLLRKIDDSRQEYNHIVVYGMPQWMQFDKIDYGYYEKLKVHISSAAFVDPNSDAIKQFRKKYFTKYGALPRQEAMQGYDIMLYFGRMIHKYGTKFQYYLPQDPAQELLTRYEFKPVLYNNDAGVDFYQIDHFENKFLNILKFEDYQFQKAD